MPALLRLTYAIEMAKAGGWYQQITEYEFIMFGKKSIEKGFDSNGKQIAPLHIRVLGQVVKLLSLLECFGLKLDASDSDLSFYTVKSII